jgi:hypothetical protein
MSNDGGKALYEDLTIILGALHTDTELAAFERVTEAMTSSPVSSIHVAAKSMLNHWRIAKELADET